MATEPATPWALLDGKASVPSELRTAEWARVPQWIRERSFYMAGVHRAEILQEFRDEARNITEGTASMAESERDLRAMLERVGYEPEPGQEGTIKDLRSVRRMQRALRTNVELLQGWSRKERGLRPGAQIAVPAWELVRFESRKRERLWRERWLRAGGKLYEGRMIALKTDGIWLVLGTLFPDSLGVDYPPFAWGSGMGWQGVSRAECKRLGVLPAGWKPPAPQPVSSPSENLSFSPRVNEPTIRAALAEDLRGLARWEGERLVFTDPNGSRPADPPQVIAMWETPLPEPFRTVREDGDDGGLYQKLALKRWLADPEGFSALASRESGLDLAEDLLRLYRRLPGESEKDVTLLIETLKSTPKAGSVLSTRGSGALELFLRAGQWLMEWRSK